MPILRRALSPGAITIAHFLLKLAVRPYDLERGPVMRRAILAASVLLVIIALYACGGGGGGNNNNPPVVTVSPATANVQEAAMQQFTATVSTGASNVNWQVNSIAGGNSSVGTIDSTGLYTAPVIVPNPASVTITAVLQANTSVTGNAIVTVTAVQFNNSSLRGNYVFSLTGIDVNGFPFYAVGAITADGSGHITGGEEDLNDVSSGYVQASSVTGTYSVGSDGRGTLNLNSSIGSFSYAFAIQALNNAGLNEIDNNVINATGNLEQQTTTGVSAPSGNYAFGFGGSGLNCSTSAVNSIGILNLGSGTVGGLQDLNCGGTTTQNEALDGSYSGIDSLGRGTGSFSASTGSASFVYYVISTNRFRFMCPNPGTFFLGSADLQTQPSFGASDFNGSYVVSSSANTLSGVSYALIQFNASGGSVSSGYYDVNDTGRIAKATLTGTYMVASNGHISGSFSTSLLSLPFSMYLISPGKAYYLDQQTTGSGGGNVYAQASSVTTNAAWVGSYATEQFGYFLSGGMVRPNNSTSVSGQISADGSGTLAGTLDFNDPTSISQGQGLQGTYSVGMVAPGRTTVTTTTAEGTRNYVAYIVDQGRVLLLETDTNLVSSGDAIRQF
jgi:hypothetical protein